MSLKKFFNGVSLEIEDLYLLESFQIAYLPGWVPERELTAVLRARPTIRRFLVKRCPAIADFIEQVLAQHGPAADEEDLASCEHKLVWTIADLLVYNKCPEFYDGMDFHHWDFNEINSITPLKGKIVLDAGAGTGRVALEAAQTARHVFAVEPVSRLRQFMRDKAASLGLDNMYVLDGFLQAIPLPNDFADVLITSHALGWQLEQELAEFERVVRPAGHIIHCPGTADGEREQALHERLISPDLGYAWARYRQPDGWKRKYYKIV